MEHILPIWRRVRAASFSILNGSLADGTPNRTAPAIYTRSFSILNGSLADGTHHVHEFTVINRSNFQYPQRIVNQWNRRIHRQRRQCHHPAFSILNGSSTNGTCASSWSGMHEFSSFSILNGSSTNGTSGDPMKTSRPRTFSI